MMKKISTFSALLLTYISRSLFLQIIAALLCSTPILFFGVVTYHRINQVQTETIMDRKKAAAYLASGIIHERLNALINLGVSIGARSFLIQSIQNGEWENATVSMRDIPNKFPFIDRIFLYDPSGTIKATLPSNLGVVGESRTDRDWYMKVSRDWRPYVSNIYKRGSNPVKNIISILIPINDDNLIVDSSASVTEAHNRGVGILELQITMKTFSEWVNEFKSNPEEFIYVVDQLGRIIYHPKYNSEQITVDYSFLSLIHKLVKGARGTEIYYNYVDKKELVDAYEPVSGYNWGVVVSQPVKMAFMERNQDLKNMLYLFGALLLGTFGMILLLLRGMSKQKLQEDKIIQFSRIVENSPASIMITDTKGDIEYVNPRFSTVTGYGFSEVIGKNPRILKSGEHSPEFYKSLWDTLQAGQEWKGEFHNKKKNGELYWESAWISPLKDSDGKITNFVAIKEDMTERKKSQEEIRVLSNYQKALLDNAGYSIIAMDTQGIIKLFNPSAEQMLGYKAEEVINKVTSVFIHDKDEIIKKAKEISEELKIEIKPGFDVFVAKTRLNLRSVEEWTYIRKNGIHFPVLVTVSALRDEKQNIYGYLEMASDISNLKHTQDELLRLTDRFKLAKNSAQIGIWDWDVVNNIMVWDEQMFKLYGISKANFKRAYQTWQEGVYSEDLARSEQEVQDALSGKKDFNTEFRVQWPDKSIHHIKANALVTRDSSGKAIRMTGTNWDITSRKEADAKIMEAMNIKSDFISMVSHELRTPLTIIKEGISIVYDETAGSINADQKDFLQTAKNNVDRLTRLINGVLDYQKLEANYMDFRISEGSINDVVREVGQGFKIVLEHKGLLLQMQLHENLPHIKFDKDKIIQVLTNLLNNAIKFTDKGKVFLITEPLGENAIKVSVKDEGIGIKEDDLDKLFKTFSQISTGMGRTTGGTGLGLALSRKIIEAHNGKLSVSSVFGLGSTFYFILPIRERRTIVKA